MTVIELIEELEQMNPEAEVRFASQPSWPFEYSINSVIEVNEDGGTEDVRDDGESVVYLEEGTQLGYLPGHVKDELGW